MPLPFMGDTAACLAHFGARFDESVSAPLLAEFCGVIELTSTGWLRGSALPKGAGKIKLRVFLALAGYQVDEFSDLPRKTRDLTSVIAFDLASPEEVTARVGYKNVQDLYRVLLGGGGMSTDKQRKLDELLDEFESKLNRSRARWRARLETLLGVDFSDPAPVAGVVLQEPVGRADEPELVGHLIDALSLVLDNGNQDSIGPRANVPMPLPEDRVREIIEFIDEGKIRRLVAQLEMLR
jgi:hypothetical protein